MDTASIPNCNGVNESAGKFVSETTHEAVVHEPTIDSAQVSAPEPAWNRSVLLSKWIRDRTRDLAFTLQTLVFTVKPKEYQTLSDLSNEADEFIAQYALGVYPTCGDAARIFDLGERALALMADCHDILVGEDEMAADYYRYSDLPADELETEFDKLADMLTEAGHTPSRPKLKQDMQS